MTVALRNAMRRHWPLAVLLLVVAAIYWPGLRGGYLFDDFPNIVDNHALQLTHLDYPSLKAAALSSPSTDLKRPLAYLSFAFNEYFTGLAPGPMKTVNLIVHLLNALLVYALLLALLQLRQARAIPCTPALAAVSTPPSARGGRLGGGEALDLPQPQHSEARAPLPNPPLRAREGAERSEARAPLPNPPLQAREGAEPAVASTPPSARGGRLGGGRSVLLALAITAAWALAPINLTSVLYVVQRMESLCNLFVLAGLWAYLHGRERQLVGRGGWWWIAAGLFGATGLGLLAKESALLLPLYAMLLEWALLRWRCADERSARLLRGLHWTMLALGVAATLLVLPRFLAPGAWSARAFTLGQRLLTEPRVLWSYIDWTLLPNLGRLGFYYDDYRISTGLFSPLSTAFALAALIGLAIAAILLRRRVPLASLGIGWFLAAHAMTATVIPLELVFEHRNYFASIGLLLALLSVAAALLARPPWRRIAPALLIAWLLWLGFVTALRVQEWRDPLRLAQSLAAKQPQSPRTQYELGRTYLLLSHYDPASPFTAASRRVLERASALPDGSPLAEQALLMQSGHLRQPGDPAWWARLEAKLQQRPPGPQEIESLYSLVQCTIAGDCSFTPSHMQAALQAALRHPSPQVLAIYANYAINVLHDRTLALSLASESVRLAPRDPKFRENLILLLAIDGQTAAARAQLGTLQGMIGNDAADTWAQTTLVPMQKGAPPAPGDSK